MKFLKRSLLFILKPIFPRFMLKREHEQRLTFCGKDLFSDMWMV